MERSINSIAGGFDAKEQPCGGREPYSVALAAALLILEEVDTLPPSNVPIRLAKVIGIVLDAIYESQKQPRGVHHGS